MIGELKLILIVVRSEAGEAWAKSSHFHVIRDVLDVFLNMFDRTDALKEVMNEKLVKVMNKLHLFIFSK
jgi:hypothetical protein